MGIVRIFGNGDMTFVHAVAGLPFVEEDWMKERKPLSQIQNNHGIKSISKILQTERSHEINKFNP